MTTREEVTMSDEQETAQEEPTAAPLADDDEPGLPEGDEAEAVGADELQAEGKETE